METHYCVFYMSAAVSGLSGLAALLRSHVPLTVLGVVSTLLNSSLMGLGLSLVWYNQFPDSPHTLVGICVLLGLGGQPTMDFLLRLFLRGGLNITFGGGNLQVGPSEPEKSTETKDDRS